MHRSPWLPLASLFSLSLCPAQKLALVQERDNAPARSATRAELAALGDPLFTLVLARHANVTALDEIERLIQPDPKKRQAFVVSENIADRKRGQRRSVLSFTGRSGAEILDGNVMLSVFFDPDSFDAAAIEAWGWDSRRGRYNFYRLDNTGTPAMALTWKLRGSSVDADLLGPAERKGTCMACHVNGAPVMKELLRPWNNWHSPGSPAAYLDPDADRPWRVAASPRLSGVRDGPKAGGLGSAEDLQGTIVSSIRQFNRRRINQALARRDDTGDILVGQDGTQQVLDGQRLLRHLLVTTEFNIASAREASGLHPFPKVDRTGPAQAVQVPSSFFLNANLLAGGTVLGYHGLGIATALTFAPQVEPAEYRRLVLESDLELGGRQPGDASFAWFVPEPGHVDNDVVSQMLERGIVSPQLVAAALSIDLETPVLSPARAGLLEFMPDRWSFLPGAPRHPDDLTRQVIAALETGSASRAADSPAARFLAVLKDPDPVAKLTREVVAYQKRVTDLLGNAATRQAELDRLFERAIGVRRAVLRDPVLGQLDETRNRLFPLP